MDASQAPPAEPDDLSRRDAVVHREFLQLAVLMVIAVAAFFLTRAVAASGRNLALADAEAWFARGEQQIASGQVDAGIQSLRRASVRNRYERRYALALARALAQQGDTDAARTTLLMLREASPDDAEINFELARLAAERRQHGSEPR